MVAVALVHKAVLVKEAVALGTVVDGQAQRANHPVVGVVMHHQAVAKNKPDVEFA